MNVKCMVVGVGVVVSAAAWSAPPAGVGAGGIGEGARAPVADWRAEWRAVRNAMFDANPKLASDPTSILVQFEPAALEADKAVVRSLVAGRTISTFALTPGLEHVAVANNAEDAARLVDWLGKQLGVVQFAEPDHTYHLFATPADTYYSLLWGLHNAGQTVAGDPGVADRDIDGPEAWDIITTTTMPIAVCDSGLRRTHEDITGNLWTNPGEIAGNGIDDDGNGYVDDTQGWDFYFNDNDPNDGNGHGTHVAGTIGAKGNNSKGVTGVNWNCKLVSLRIANASGSISSSAAISAINYCVAKGIKVSNHSWGGGGYSQSMFNTISAARTAGHLVIAAAGNGGADGVGDNNDSIPQYPASYNLDNIISVAAVNNDGNLASFSNFGATSVDLAAPGVLIASCYSTNNTSYVYLDGTSMATPHVTGVAALVWTRYPAWTYSQVRSRILSSVMPLSSLSGKCATGGLLNANGAVQ
ncbi:MAG: S8 family peptidase [Phycisphaerales bacterium]